MPDPTSLDAPISLYDGPLELQARQGRYTLDGAVQLRWMPTPRIAWYGGATDDGALAALGDPDIDVAANLGVVVGRLQPPSNIRQPDDFKGQPLFIDGYEPDMQIGQTEGLTRATFFLANTPSVWPGELLSHDGAAWTGRLALSGGGWTVTLDSRRERVEIEAWLKRTGSYTITHTGSISLTSGKQFSVEEVNNALWLLQTTLSFGTGRHVAPLVPVAYDTEGQAVWTGLRSPLLSPWRGNYRVADPHHPEQWRQLFTRFASLWDDEFRREVLLRAVRFYLDANKADPIELSVNTAQSGLELLAYSYLVEDHHILTDKLYGPPAHKNLTNYLTRIGVGTRIPLTFARLQAAADGQQCANGPEIITRMRNGVSHPSRKKPKFTIDVWLEAWRLSLRYLILGVLHYVDYHETYRDPTAEGTWIGTVSNVPWEVPSGKDGA